MKRQTLLALVTLALLALALPVVAGEKGYECTASAQECLNKMAEKMANKGWFGVELDHTQEGLLIKKVIENSPAEKAGVKQGEVLIALNGVRYDAGEEAIQAVQKKATPGKVVTFTLSSGGHDKDVKVTLAALPEEYKARWLGYHMLESHAEVAVN